MRLFFALPYHYVRYFVLMLPCVSSLVMAVTVINVTLEEPVYFAVYYRKSYKETRVQAIKYSPKEGCYTAQPAGKEFLQGVRYTTLPHLEFNWPAQVCKGGVGDICTYHYPRTVLFSFVKNDIVAGNSLYSDPIGASFMYQGKDIGSALYRGDNIDGGETHFIYYNAYGFDPRYAAYAKLESGAVVKAGKLNSVQADTNIESTLRRYTEFMQYQYFGK